MLEVNEHGPMKKVLERYTASQIQKEDNGYLKEASKRTESIPYQFTRNESEIYINDAAATDNVRLLGEINKWSRWTSTLHPVNRISENFRGNIY